MMPPKLILGPTDFSDPSHAALDVAADMASRFGAELLLVHVVPVIPDLPDSVTIFKEEEYEQNLQDIAAKQLSELAATLGQKNVKIRTEVGLANDVGMELVRIAEHNHADMIVIRHARHDWLAPDRVWIRGQESGGGGRLPRPGAACQGKGWRHQR